MWFRSSVPAGLVFSCISVTAAPALGAPASPEQDEAVETEPARPFAPALAPPPGLGAALEGYAGIAVLFGPGDTRSRGLVGGLLRLRYRYFQLGGSVEVSDSGQADALNEQLEESWRALGVFGGAWLPFERWIVLDAAVGYADRRFTNPDRIYGPNGLDLGGPALTWRFGISDRFGKRPFGARLGAALLGTVDLRSLSAPYERTFLTGGGAIGVTRGTTDVGGVSIALVVGGGFELGGLDRSWLR